MKLVFDDQAIADLEDIFNWIAQDSHAAAKSVPFPRLGHIGRDPETFEWVVPRLPYVVVYEIDRQLDQVVITAVFHGAQDRKPK